MNNDFRIKLLKENDDNKIVFNKVIPEPLPQPHFTMILVAPSMGGKGLNTINTFYRSDMLGDIYDIIIYVSPSIRNDVTAQIVRDSPKTIIYDDPNNLDKIVTELMEIQEVQEGERINDKNKVLLIVDDALGYVDKRTSKLNSFISRNRHYSVSTCFLIQNFKYINNSIRSNCHYYQISRLNNSKEEQKIFEEIGVVFCPVNEFKKYYEYATKDSRFDRLYCMMRERKLYKNYDELLFDGSNQK
tara:strand:- start:416 stop:1147 length:732 start_codon:yes stop_codon:yes gene_type:complete